MHRLIHRQSPVFMIHNQTITDPQSLEGYGGVDDCLTMCLRCFFFHFCHPGSRGGLSFLHRMAWP